MVGIEAEDETHRELNELFRELRSLALVNRAYYKRAPGITNERLHASFTKLLDHLDNGVVRGVNDLLRSASRFDYDETHQGNGFRSLVTVIQKCCLHILALSRYITVNRESYLFRAGHYGKELEAFVTVLGQLRAILYYLQKLVGYCKDGELFPDELSFAKCHNAQQLMMEVEYLSQESFYGRCLGFQFCESMGRPLTAIGLFMAVYAEGYKKSKSSLMRFANSLLGCRKYLMNPELRAQQVVDMTRTSDINFCKSFWNLPENSFMHNAPLYVCPATAVSKVITIDPVPFQLPLVNGSGCMTILPPSAQTGVGPVLTRLISSEYRSGQEIWFNSYAGLKIPFSKMPVQRSPYLVIHCHGGGFVAQSSASHQMYLNHWACDLDIPIFSVDYSLAPENHFPRQQEEVFFAYCWALANCNKLGSLAEKIIVVGDSAGANIAVSVAMRLAACGLRQPDGILSVYGCFMINYVPSPSRILALMDPLLPIGILSDVLRAYTGDIKHDNQNEDMTVDGCTDNTNSSDAVDKSEKPIPYFQNSCNGVQYEELDSTRQAEVVGKNPADMSLSDFANYQNNLNQHDREKYFLPEVVLGNFRQHHRREDSGFFDVSDSGSSSKCSDEMLSSSDNNLAAESGSGSSSAVFALKESSDEESDSFPSSSDEQSAQDVIMEKHAFQNNPLSSISRDNCDLHTTFRQTNSAPVLSKSDSRTTLRSPVFDSGSPLTSNYAKLCHYTQSPMESAKGLKLAKNPFVSPVLAPDDLLQRLCPVHIMACHLDPLLDDSIMFARRLRALKKNVDLEFVSDVPHGFLNFVLVSPEAKAGSNRCVQAIRTLLQLEA